MYAGRAGRLEADLEKSIDELALLKEPLDTALAIIIQNIMSRVVFIDRFRVFRRNEFDGGENDRISFRQDMLIQNNTVFARQGRCGNSNSVYHLDPRGDVFC
jgi:hypothetical protein